MSVLLELGPGTIPHPRARYGLDLHHPFRAPVQDIASEKWQKSDGVIPDNSIDELFASHVLEHVAKGQPIIHVMSEALRVLKPGGTFTMVLPLVGYTDEYGNGHSVQGWQPYADPTHVQFWWAPESWLYFCEGPFKPNADYGLPVWNLLGSQVTESEANRILQQHRKAPDGHPSFWAVRGGWEGVVRLVAP